MCIIDGGFYGAGGRVARVHGTRILAARCRDGASQLTVYANAVALGPASAPVAMILPVPVGDNKGGAERVRMVDTSEDPSGARLWDALAPLFKEREASFGLDGDGGGARLSNRSAALPVLRCGSYEYSVVPSVDDFGRLDARLAGRPSAGVEALLRERYARGFAFLVCRIARGGAYHPVAYTHPLGVATGTCGAPPTTRRERESGDREEARLFVPTLHWHGDEREAPGKIEWDHTIYVLGAHPGDPSGWAAACTDAEAARLPWRLPLCYAEHLPPDLAAAQLRCREVRGRGAAPNEDMWWRCAANHAEPGSVA